MDHLGTFPLLGIAEHFSEEEVIAQDLVNPRRREPILPRAQLILEVVATIEPLCALTRGRHPPCSMAFRLEQSKKLFSRFN